jgi:hypothetical protein
VAETRCYLKSRAGSTDVEEEPSAECPIGPGSTCPSPAQRGRGEPGTTWGTRYLPHLRLQRGSVGRVENSNTRSASPMRVMNNPVNVLNKMLPGDAALVFDGRLIQL